MGSLGPWRQHQSVPEVSLFQKCPVLLPWGVGVTVQFGVMEFFWRRWNSAENRVSWGHLVLQVDGPYIAGWIGGSVHNPHMAASEYPAALTSPRAVEAPDLRGSGWTRGLTALALLPMQQVRTKFMWVRGTEGPPCALHETESGFTVPYGPEGSVEGWKEGPHDS